MPYAQIEEGVRLYYELTGPEDRPVVLQFGGGLFGRGSSAKEKNLLVEDGTPRGRGVPEADCLIFNYPSAS
jgi:hypothetical protein